MSLRRKLKKLFPKPHIPQKRYLVVLGVVVYIALKIYVAHTPDPSDDQLPDQLRGMIIDMFADNADSPSSDYDSNGMRYGERT